MILVTGAAGKTGLAVTSALKQRGASVRALIRHADQEGAVLTAGAAEGVIADLQNAGQLIRAMRGIAAVYLICPNVHPYELSIGATAISAAKLSGVRRLVYHSVLFPDVEAMPHHWQKFQVEKALKRSGFEYTILQPASYMQNILPYWEGITAAGEYRVPYSVDAVFTPLELGDVAEVAATVLGSDGHAGRTYALAGPQPLTSAQMADEIADLLGREVHAQQQSIQEWRAGAKKAGLNPYAIDALQRMFSYYDRHGFAGSSKTLEGLLGRPPSRFSEFLARLEK
ncbi:MAG: NmrA family NAD(P)-binding protein [Anaerolineales bacterium]